MSGEAKGKTIDIGVVMTWLGRNWKAISGCISLLGLFVFVGYRVSETMADFRYQHNAVVRDVEVLKANANVMENELRGLRESSIRLEVILERIERKLP